MAVVVVVMVFVVVVLVVLALLAVFVLAFIVSGPVSHGPGFVDALAADDDRGAYNLLCERTASRVTFDDFVARYAPAKPVTSVSKVTSGGSFSDPPDKVEATFTFTDGTTRTLTYVAEAGPDGNLYVCDPPTFQR